MLSTALDEADPEDADEAVELFGKRGGAAGGGGGNRVTREAWLVELCQEKNLQLKAVSVHSHNPVGATNIQSLINGFKRHMGWPEDCYLGRHPFTVEKQ